MKNEKYIRNYINGELVDPISNEYLDNFNPATGEVYSYVPDSGKQDVQNAVEAAYNAFSSWSTTPVDIRARLLERIADIINQNIEVFAEAESTDTGKPLKLAEQLDIPRSVNNFRFFASGVRHFSTESHPVEDQALNYTLRDPLGVVGCISPWNLPLYLLTWKIAPALAMGNCVVAKPSELTPMTSFLLAQACQSAGLPPGVLNIVHGSGGSTGESIVEHPHIKGISFTGGTETGKRIARIAGPSFKKLQLEMGGKNPTIIFADCDYEEMMKTTIRSAFSNQGQICLCGSRIFVERPIYEKFKLEFVEKTRMLKVGDPASKHTRLGAVISRNHQQKILSYIELAKEEGGEVLCGGGIPSVNKRCESGFFVEPTIIDGLAPSCRTNQEEIFGPVVTIMPFDTDEEVLEYANGTRYGLAASLWTENLTRAHTMAKNLQNGIVWVNCWMLRDLRTPFGGMKDSGTGREGGWEAMKFFTEAKNVCIKF